MMSLDFPFKTEHKVNSKKYRGNSKENAVFLYVGATTRTAKTAQLHYSIVGAVNLTVASALAAAILTATIL